MVARVRGYYSLAFQVFRGVTQGYPMSPTIFDVVVDIVVQNWVKEMVEGAGRQVGRRQDVRHQNSLLYTDDSMIAFSDLGWLQGVFSTLVGLFDSVVLKKNSRKTAGMVFNLCQSVGTQLEAVYELRMTVAGPYYQERQRVRVQCSECGEDMALGSLAFHLQTHHRKATGSRRHWGGPSPGG